MSKPSKAAADEFRDHCLELFAKITKIGSTKASKKSKKIIEK